MGLGRVDHDRARRLAGVVVYQPAAEALLYDAGGLVGHTLLGHGLLRGLTEHLLEDRSERKVRIIHGERSGGRLSATQNLCSQRRDGEAPVLGRQHDILPTSTPHPRQQRTTWA